MLLIYFLLFIIGLCIGSFLNVVIFRLDRQKGIFLGRSKCLYCQTQLHWYELLPLISFISLKGKCRYCKKRISPVYPIVELVTACVAVSYFMTWGLSSSLVSGYYFVALLLLILLLFFDSLYFILPDKVVFALIGLALGYDIMFMRLELLNFLVSGFILALIFAILYIVSRGSWVGFGDIKFLFAIGLLMGYPLGFIVLILSVWTAALTGILLIILRKATLKTALPFGAFLAAITIIFIIFYHEIQNFTYQIL